MTIIETWDVIRGALAINKLEELPYVTNYYNLQAFGAGRELDEQVITRIWQSSIERFNEECGVQPITADTNLISDEEVQ